MKIRPEILLHPNIPKPLHGQTPRSIMGRAWWDTVRQAAYALTDYHCAACGVHKSEAEYHHWLEAHELYDFDYPRGRLTLIEIVALCHACHNFIHSGRMQNMVGQGTFPVEKMECILIRGETLIRAFGLKAPDPPDKVAAWGDWRLVFNGQEYPPLWKNQEEWHEAYFD